MNKLTTFFRETGPARFLIPAGLFILIFGIIALMIDIQNKDYIETEAIVSKTELVEESHTDSEGNPVDATYKVYVKYTVNNTEYEEELGELSGYEEKDKITIYYNPKDPKQITQTKSIILPIVMIVGGSALLIGGIISAINSLKKMKKMKLQEKEWENGK